MTGQRTDIKRLLLMLFFVSFLILIISGCSKPEVVVEVDSITISTANNATEIDTIGGTLQFSAAVLPADATDKAVIWSVQNDTGEATITVNGLLAAVSNGTVTVKATAHDNLSKTATKVITLSNQDVVVNSISISSEEDRAFIDEYHGTLQLSAVILPANATDQSVVWSVQDGTGSAMISANGLLTALASGTVTVKAGLTNDSSIFGTKIITLTNQEIAVNSITVGGQGDAVIIDVFQGSLQMSALILPANATDKTVVWSVENGTGSATISASGLLTAISNGTVTVKAASSSDDLVFGTKVITISNQEVLVTSIDLTSEDDIEVIDQFGGTLQFNADVLPSNAVDKSVEWSVINGSGEATISASGLLTAVANGTVTVVVTSLSNSAVDATMVITISNQEVVASSITVTGQGDAIIIDVLEGTLQMNALVLPANAADKSVVWSVQDVTGSATITATGLLVAVSNGTVIVKAASTSDALIFGTREITISNQIVMASSIIVSGQGDAAIINVFQGTLQMNALVLPANAADKSVVWSVQAGTGSAMISANGLLTALSNGTVTVKAGLTNDSSIFGIKLITISNQEVVASSITVSGQGDATIINVFQGTLQMNAVVLPTNATDKTVEWSVQNGTGQATISTSGLLTAVANGTVTVKAASSSDASVFGIKVITLSNQEVLASSITVSGQGDAVIINVLDGTLQMNALVLPANAADKTVVWSVQNNTGSATITANGLLTAVANGMVTVKATLSSNALVFGTKVITISNQEVLASSITVSGQGDAVIIDVFEGTLQMNALVLPENATDKTVVWTVENGTGSASISIGGLLTAVENGTVTVKATSSSNALVYGIKVITISNQDVFVPVSSITVSGQGDAIIIDVFEGTLQMSALVLPEDATDKTVVWSVENGTGQATIDVNGLLTAVADGTVTVKATSSSDALKFGTKVITISNQIVIVPVSSITVSGQGDAIIIDVFEGSLQMNALVLPENATDKSVVWTVENGTGSAMISASGLLTASSNGTVTVKATSVSDELVFGTKVITISNQEVLVTSIELTSAGDVQVIDQFGGTLQFSANVLPANAFDKSVTWSVIIGSGEATISNTGLLTAVANGTVTVVVTSVSNPNVDASMIITISNQEVVATSITVTGQDGAVIIDVLDGTLQMIALVLPENAADKSVIWSVENGSGEASISATGLLTAVANGIVTVKATSTSDPLVFGTRDITISNQRVIPAKVNLLTAGDFTILSKTGISTAANSMVIGNMGVSPVAATYITGFSLILDSTTSFSTSAQVVGKIYAADYSTPTPDYLTQAISDMEAAYTDAASRAPDVTELAGGNLSGLTLVGGVYKFSTDVTIYTNLTLSGSADDVWIFQISGTLTQAVSVQIILSGGARVENVFWQVAGGVAIETSAQFVGTILSMTEITLGTNATANGKLLSQTAVTLDANIVSFDEIIDVESIVVTSEADATEISILGGTLQMYAAILPIDATDKTVVWSVVNGTGEATIDENGLLTAVRNGLVTVKAASTSSNGLIFGTKDITLSNQEVLVTSITVSGQGDAIIIDAPAGTLQMNALVLPVDATDKTVIWSVENGTGQATIGVNGLLTAVANGLVTVKATSTSDPLMFGTLDITISNQEVLVTSITVSGQGDAIIIDAPAGTLQMNALVLPENATDKTVVWSVENGTGQATIDVNGLLTAVADGTVTVKATSSSDALIFGTKVITISNQPIVDDGGVDLLSAADFIILSETGITTTVGTHITGNIGVSPITAAAMTGFGLTMDSTNEFSTSSLVTGKVYASDYAAPTPAYLTQAILDMHAAYDDAASRAPDVTEAHAGNISGQTLVPGVYYWSSGLLIDTDVTLSGSETDVWIFQIAGTLTQAAGARILLSGGANASNIVWQVSLAVSIGVGAHFEGTILGKTAVNLGTNATFNGKIFAQTAVTLDSNIIN